MDERLLRELELLPVARLFGLATSTGSGSGAAATATAPPASARPASAAAVPEPRTIELSEPVKPRLEAPVVAPGAMAGVETMDWGALRDAVAQCRRCRLCEQRKQAVFGVGNESAPWLFVGEGPGADEDERGEPFVGQAGKLLDSMLAALRMARGSEAYIANVVKCRPPGNRVPSLEEASACAAFLDRQIDLIRPKIIVALGKTAAVRLTGSEGSLAGQRGRVYAYRGIPLVVTYHPAYLLRNLPDKAKAWEDLLFARRTMQAASGPKELLAPTP